MIPFELGGLSNIEGNMCAPAFGDSASGEEGQIGTWPVSFSFFFVGWRIESRSGLASPFGPTGSSNMFIRPFGLA